MDRTPGADPPSPKNSGPAPPPTVSPYRAASPPPSPPPGPMPMTDIPGVFVVPPPRMDASGSVVPNDAPARPTPALRFGRIDALGVNVADNLRVNHGQLIGLVVTGERENDQQHRPQRTGVQGQGD